MVPKEGFTGVKVEHPGARMFTREEGYLGMKITVKHPKELSWCMDSKPIKRANE